MNLKRQNLRFEKSNRAIALIFFLLVFGLTLSFTMVVFNTGMIVYQKMRLQTAVDLAAYAGASVQASYLGNESSGQDSLTAINDRIVRRYIKLLEDINTQPSRVVPMVPTVPVNYAACVASCVAANVAVSSRAVSIYKEAVRDIEMEHEKARRILEQLPAAVRAVAEKTLALNIPELTLEEGPFGGATRDLEEVINNPLGNMTGDPRNINLAFTSDKGMYLANVVAGVPHRMVYFGPYCANAYAGLAAAPLYYCTVNGQGATGTPTGYALAIGALARAIQGGELSGNVGHVKKISGTDSRAVKLQFIEDPHKPQPFVVTAAEWFPKTGQSLNFEKTFGARGDLIPEHTRLAAVAAAEPFGGFLATQQVTPFGTRLTAIRKVLLDPRMNGVRSDFGGLYDYMQYVGPKDEKGDDIESVEETIRRFLH
jgi:hypothetical protein